VSKKKPDLDSAVANLFAVGFHGTTMTEDLTWLIDRGVSMVILFKRNVDSPEQVAKLCGEIKRRAARPILIAIDQEGGRVARLRGRFTDIPSMRDVGRANDIDLARHVGMVLGKELRAVNIDLDFAPCMDVDTNPANPVIGDRSFGKSPQLVTRMGVAVIEGLQSAGIAACAKHFPGHGDTDKDSHYVLPTIDHPLERLERIELPPFAAAIRAGVATVMTAHVLLTQVDPDVPATMSEKVMRGLLRDRLGFNGVVISDDLEMRAIAEHYGAEQAILRGLHAGVDLFCICHNHQLQHRAIDRLIDAVEAGDVRRELVDQANARINALAAQYAHPAHGGELGVIGCNDHVTVAYGVRQLAGSVAGTAADPTEFEPTV
jgi:beta-N-acetylhexosaminidase